MQGIEGLKEPITRQCIAYSRLGNTRCLGRPAAGQCLCPDHCAMRDRNEDYHLTIVDVSEFSAEWLALSNTGAEVGAPDPDDEYTCALCHGVFTRSRPESIAEAEAERMFNVKGAAARLNKEMVEVCNGCFLNICAAHNLMPGVVN